MTRINLIPPKDLTRLHLIAEYKELPRTFNLVRKRIDKEQRPSDCNIPDTYRLGPGHVTFFYDKLMFLKKRQISLINEMRSRGYSPNFGEPDISDIPDEWLGDYNPTPEAIKLSQERINSRLT